MKSILATILILLSFYQPAGAECGPVVNNLNALNPTLAKKIDKWSYLYFRPKPALRLSDIASVDPTTVPSEVRVAVVKIHNFFINPKLLNKYFKELAQEVISEMESKGRFSKELTEKDTLTVLVRRAQKRGEKIGIVKAFATADFFSVVAQGPFFDMAFKNQDHGRDTHLVQMDMVSSIIHEATHGKPEIFWNYVGTLTPKTDWLWVKLFDNRDGGSYMSPEYLGSPLFDIFNLR